MKANKGFTLIELLIVVAIIGLLLQLFLPAVEMSRESARQVQCQNNLRQLAVAAQVHQGAHEHFPTGGWTHVWTGDPNRGSDENQPGGWCYNLLPFLEQSSLRDLGKGAPDAERRRLGAQMFATPVSTFTCPSRRLVRPWKFIRADTLVNIEELKTAGRSDYAANMGNAMPSDQQGRGPRSLEEGDQWEEGSDPESSWIATQHNGVVYQRSLVTPAMIEDGLSNTYLIGEKFMNPRYYKTGESNGDDQSLYVGFDRDNIRSGNFLHPPMRDKEVPIVYLRDTDSPEVTDWNFGSSHPSGLHMALCDGSVRKVNYDIEITVHSMMSSRSETATHVSD